METHLDYWEAHAVLQWQVELGVSEAIGEVPVNRYEAPKTIPKAPQTAHRPERPAQVAAKHKDAIDPADAAQQAVANVDSLDALRTALERFEHCPLKRGARNLVFCDGNPSAKLMIVADTPSREDDLDGVPFSGPQGALLDKMFGAIDLSRSATDAASGLYLSSALPWRPPANRDPSVDELACLRPFLLKHIELANPDMIVLMGNWACSVALGKTGLTRLRGKWDTVLGKPAMPMSHPRDLIRTAAAKRDAWADLLEIRARLNAMT